MKYACSGAVKQVELPENWQSAAPQDLAGGRVLEKFSSIQYPPIRFCSYLRQLPLSTPAARAFEQTLYSEFHQLTKEELVQLEDVIEGMSNPAAFEPEQAYTAYLNSRRILRVQGRWLQSAEKMLSVFIDLHGNGQVVQQLYFVCPETEFPALAETGENILLSVEWNS